MKCKNCGSEDMLNIYENPTCEIIFGKGKIINQWFECQNCKGIEKRQAVYSNIGIGQTRNFEGVYNG
jgi:hypothetical protein